MKQQYLITYSRDEVNNANLTEIRTLNKKTYAQVWNDSPFATDNANSIFRFEVGDEDNQHARGTKLLKALIKLYDGKYLVEQVSNEFSLDMHYCAGFRVEGVKTLRETMDLLKKKGPLLMEVHTYAKVSTKE